MGTWDDGLYDNDSALDTLGDLVSVSRDEQDAAQLVARIGLLAWMNPVAIAHDKGDLEAQVAAHADALLRLPADTQGTLRSLLADPAALTREGSRTPAVREALGGYCDGPRLDHLLRFPGAQAALNDLAERAAQLLERSLRQARDLYELSGNLAALGVLIELQQAGFWSPAPSRLASWYTDFVAIDKATKDERGFWWRYVRRVCKGFALLGHAAAGAASEAARAPRAPRSPRAAARSAPTGPVERFSHPTFGVATLRARSGVGETETLELLFEDGVVRKIRKKFVTAIAE